MLLLEMETLLRERLAGTLPGVEAQMRFAPFPVRPGWRAGHVPEGTRAAAALLLVYPVPDGTAVPLTVRASGLAHHPGQISLPGGAVDEKRSVNYTIVSDEENRVPRVYSNLCSIQNSTFDFTLSFCEMLPLGEREIQQAQTTQVVKAPVRARMVVPVQMVPGLIAALQENFRLYQESFGPAKGPAN